MQYVILSPDYTENSGGPIVLHKLCDLLNRNGEKAYMFPYNYDLLFARQGKRWRTYLLRLIHFRRTIRGIRGFRNYVTNPEWNTPVYNLFKSFFLIFKKDTIVVYPEAINNNPCQVKNVVRYLLHNPGFWTGEVNYGKNELYFRYSDSFARDFVPNEGSVVSKNLLTIFTTPKCYNMEGAAERREGTAYLLRKGHYKKLCHNLSDSIKIDGLSHKEIADIFKKVKCFFSYDAATAYTDYAMLCGCPVVIILDGKESPATYRPSEESRRHITFRYDYEDVDVECKDVESARIWAEGIRDNRTAQIERLVKVFVEETKEFFDFNNV